MRHDQTEPPEPPYSGPYVVFVSEGDGFHYSAMILPLLPTGDGERRVFASKSGAWWQVIEWAREYRLPVRDLTNSNANKLHDK